MNGEDAGEPKDSALALVVNTKPAVGSVKLTPEEAYADSVLTCTPLEESDADGDEVTFSYAWKVNGTEVPGETEATLQGAFNKGKEVRCVVTPFDGIAEGAAVISNPVTIGNKLPIILGVTLNPSYGAVCDEYICSVDQVVDPDEDDNVLVSYRWELNGAPVLGQGETFSNPDLEPGDELQCFVQASDGTLGPPRLRGG